MWDPLISTDAVGVGMEADTTGAIDSEGLMDLDFVGAKYVNQCTWRTEQSFVKF